MTPKQLDEKRLAEIAACLARGDFYEAEVISSILGHIAWQQTLIDDYVHDCNVWKDRVKELEAAIGLRNTLLNKRNAKLNAIGAALNGPVEIDPDFREVPPAPLCRETNCNSYATVAGRCQYHHEYPPAPSLDELRKGFEFELGIKPTAKLEAFIRAIVRESP